MPRLRWDNGIESDIMVPSIENQIHQFRREKEEERCKRLEEEFNKTEATKGKRVKRKDIPKPWKRPGRNALCQGIDMLMMVDEYDFDLADSRFQQCCSERGVLHVAGEVASRRWEYFLDYTKSKSEYLEDPFHQYAEEVNGKRYRYATEELEAGWKIVLLGRAQLQDCWELFSRDNPE